MQSKRNTGKKYSQGSGRDKKPFKKERDFSKKRDSDKKSGSSGQSGERKSFHKKEDDFRPRKKFDGDKKYGDKDDFRPRKKFEGEKSYGDKKEYKPRYDKDSSDKPRRKFEGDKKYGDKDDFRPRKKFEGEKSYGDKKEYKPRYDKDSSDKPRRKFEGDKKYGDKDDFRPRKKFDGEKSYGDKREYKPKFESAGRKPVNDKTKKKFNPNDDLAEPSFSFDDHQKDKKRFESEKKKYQSLSKGSKKSFSSPKKEDDGTIRLNKYLSNAGICSRREADQLIESGVIKVNGKVVTELGTKILPTDKVSYGDQTVKTETLVYLLLNKPKDYITTVDDPNKRRTVMELIKGACKERIYPVGRLDRNTTGLLLFTNDGELTLKLTHPKNNIKKVYHVVTDQNVTKEDMEKLRNGLELEDGFVMPDDVEFVGEGHNKKDIGVEIHSGKNRVVRRMFEHLGYKVVKLDRVMFAGLTKKDLPRGKWRLLSQKEISFLRMS